MKSSYLPGARLWCCGRDELVTVEVVISLDKMLCSRDKLVAVEVVVSLDEVLCGRDELVTVKAVVSSDEMLGGVTAELFWGFAGDLLG